MADLTKTPTWPGDQGNAAGLNEDWWVRFNWARRRVLDTYGIYLILVSGFRTYEEQVALRRQNCGPTKFDIYDRPSGQCYPATAKPGTSRHESGNAGDISPGPRSIPKVDAIFREAGMIPTVPSEDWHYEVAPNARPLPSAPPPPPEDDMAKLPNDFLIAHRTRGQFLVNGVTKLASQIPADKNIENYIKAMYAYSAAQGGPGLEDHRADVNGGTALIDFRMVNVVATQ